MFHFSFSLIYLVFTIFISSVRNVGAKLGKISGIAVVLRQNLIEFNVKGRNVTGL